MKGLIVDEPWISMILTGRKTWEMRSRHTAMRGKIALIRKGSGQVVGLARVVDSSGPFDRGALESRQDKHGIRPGVLSSGDAAKWNIAWVLEDVHALPSPVRYEHPNGAVVWVRLSEAVVDEIGRRIAGGVDSHRHGNLAASGHMSTSLTTQGSESRTEVADPGRVRSASALSLVGRDRRLVESAEVYLASVLDRTSAPSKYIAGFRTVRGREIALERERSGQICLWAETLDLAREADYVKYSAEQARNSNLNGKHAPRLQVGRRVVYMKMRRLEDLRTFVEWYVGQ